MKQRLSLWHRIEIGVGLAALIVSAAHAQSSGGGPVNVLTQHNNNARTGANLLETTLTTANVNATQFGKLFTRDVDGYLYAQPLYVQNLPIPGKGLHNVVFLATAHNSVYAYDADDPKASAPLWKVNLGHSVPAAEIYDPTKTPWTDMVVEIGITSTPVIDLPSYTIYVETKSKENGTYVQRLHALNIITGQEQKGSPVVIQGSVRGTGDGTVNGRVPFDPVKQLQRPGLLLTNDVVYLAFGSHADSAPFHGWIVGYGAKTLQQVCLFNTSPNGSDCAIWQGGMGMAADTNGLLFAVTGNGTFTAASGGADYGNSLLKLLPEGKTLKVLDYFTPYNQAELSAQDQDLGASGPVLIPGTDMLISGGKNGWLYLTSRSRLGHMKTDSDSQILQTFQITRGNIHGSPVYWNGPRGPMLYVWPEIDYLKQFSLTHGKLAVQPVAQSPLPVPYGMPGGFLAVSADGGKAGTGIVWACTPYDQNANWTTVPGIVHAYDAADVSHELWNSKMNNERDDVGMFAKFCVPTIANGKVYVSTFSGQLQVYGLVDGVLPAIDSATATSEHIVIHYKKPVDAQTAILATNYALDNGARVLRASLGPDTKTVYLATTRLSTSLTYTLTAQGVRDRANPKMTLLPATHTWIQPGAATARR